MDFGLIKCAEQIQTHAQNAYDNSPAQNMLIVEAFDHLLFYIQSQLLIDGKQISKYKESLDFMQEVYDAVKACDLLEIDELIYYGVAGMAGFLKEQLEVMQTRDVTNCTV